MTPCNKYHTSIHQMLFKKNTINFVLLMVVRSFDRSTSTSTNSFFTRPFLLYRHVISSMLLPEHKTWNSIWHRNGTRVKFHSYDEFIFCAQLNMGNFDILNLNLYFLATTAAAIVVVVVMFPVISTLLSFRLSSYLGRKIVSKFSWIPHIHVVRGGRSEQRLSYT